MFFEAMRLVPQYHARVWGGGRLQPADRPIGEAWVIYEDDVVATGPHAGRTVGALAAAHGEALLGKRPLRRTGLRIPLLIKLLDCRDWLSVQVHPDDAQAVGGRIEIDGGGGGVLEFHRHLGLLRQFAGLRIDAAQAVGLAVEK